MYPLPIFLATYKELKADSRPLSSTVEEFDENSVIGFTD